MRRTNLQLWLLMIACCLLIPTAAKAQNTYGYSSIYYDPDSNTITAYAVTDPDYATQTYYYNSYVTASVHDADGNVLANQTSPAGNPSLSFSISGNGSSGYDIVSGHYMLLSYSLVNVYSPCNNQYYNYAYYDYFAYQNFVQSPTPDGIFSLYLFFGPGPVCYIPSGDIILGSSTDSSSAPPPGARPVNFHAVMVAALANGTLRFQYDWESSTGNLDDLSNCRVGEIVTYPGTGAAYKWPAPMVKKTINPTEDSVSGPSAVFVDDHFPPNSFTHPLNSASFSATQKYRYKCGSGGYVYLTGSMIIKRTVTRNSNGSWKYTVTKSGSSATIDPIP